MCSVVWYLVSEFSSPGLISCCETLFSKRNDAKSQICSQLSDIHLNDVILLFTSSTESPFFFLIRLKFHLILTTKRLSALVYTLFSSSSSFSYSSINLNSLPSHFPPTPPSSLSYSYPWRFKTSNKFNLSLVPLANTLNPLFYATLPSLPSTPLPLPPCRLWLSGRGAGDRQARQRRVWRRR